MKYHITELFDIYELTKLCESFTKINGTVTAILDLDGNVLVATGWQPICTQFHRINSETKSRCTESDTVLAGQLSQGQKYNIYKCKNGLVDVAVPIIIDNEHVGNFFTGQFFTEKPNIDYFRQQAIKFGFDTASYLTALEKTPVFSEEEIEKTMSFLVNLTETIGNIGLKNLINLEQKKQLEIEKENLKKLYLEYAALANDYKDKNEELQLKYNEIVQIEEELRSTNEELMASSDALKDLNSELQVSKEKADEGANLKTSFLQNISHEIRTPMNAIIGFSDLLREDDISKEDINYFTTIIQNSSNQLLSIVTDILTISSVETKQEKVNLQSINLNALVNDLLSIFETQALSKNISLSSSSLHEDKQWQIYTDKPKLTQILTNIIANALKFTHEGAIEFGYNLKIDKEQPELEFYVKDTGIGIKESYHEAIFDRFRQAEVAIHKRYGGTGLGLSISKAFVELLGGKIWVESELGKGSTFYFTVPFNPIEATEKAQKNEGINKKNQLILIAEDEEYNFLLIEKLLLNYHLKILHAKDGQEAVELCKSNPDICLVLMDIKMPVMNGDEATMLIKEFRPNLPIIAQTAYGLEHEIARYKDKGFDDFITKPLNKIQLQTTVAKYVENTHPTAE